VDDAVRRRANLVLALSRMTLPHELARVVLLEQLYRAWTILRGEKYHHG
jgi:23S rRNA (pseudouridine1915-N3)-methyltransferase